MTKTSIEILLPPADAATIRLGGAFRLPPFAKATTTAPETDTTDSGRIRLGDQTHGTGWTFKFHGWILGWWLDRNTSDAHRINWMRAYLSRLPCQDYFICDG